MRDYSSMLHNICIIAYIMILYTVNKYVCPFVCMYFQQMNKKKRKFKYVYIVFFFYTSEHFYFKNLKYFC